MFGFEEDWVAGWLVGKAGDMEISVESGQDAGKQGMYAYLYIQKTKIKWHDMQK